MKRCKWLHVDLNETIEFEAAQLIHSWIVRHGIRVLNVAGSRVSKDPKIYDATFKVLGTALHLGLVETNLNKPVQRGHLPKNVDQAVDRLISKLTLKDKSKISKMGEYDLSALPFTIGNYIREEFDLGRGNEELMASCHSLAGEDDIHEKTASAIIINVLWERLRQTHALRAVK